jgi:RimJ/RimL family protein N-acetyltransferase
MIPMIETERLILREMVRGDFPAFAAIWAEPEVVRFIGGKPLSTTEAWAKFKRNAGGWVLEGQGQWGIFRKSDGVLLGFAGFFDAMRELGIDFDAVPEAGWTLSATVHRQGFGYEATVAAHEWFDAQAFGGVSVAMIDKGHVVSLGLAARLGYRMMREAEFSGDRVCLLERRRGV